MTLTKKSLDSIHAKLTCCLILFIYTLTLACVMGQTNPRQDAEPDGRDRTFNLYLQNNSDRALTFTVSNSHWSCCDSPLRQEVYGPIQPGHRIKVWIARVQGNGCDGKQGTFSLVTNDFGSPDFQIFTFSNDGYIGVANTPNRFTGELSRKNRFDGSFRACLAIFLVSLWCSMDTAAA